MTELTIALAGNPNVGKSTVFNALTGSRQHVGNWPGKTVEKKEGVLKHNNRELTVVDLPGTYSLSAFSLEEQIARDYIVEEQPKVVVDVVDAANIERNLYLTAQILETGIPVIIALNMKDLADSRGLKINATQLSEMLGGTPVIPMVASRGQGLDELKQAIVSFTGNDRQENRGWKKE
jgi:ferrous iron transport protein B